LSFKRRALLSVYNKTGIVELAKFLKENKFEIISSGGTQKHLEKNGIKTISIESITGFPEMLNGRVKTLHPKILGGVLAKRIAEHEEQLKTHDINTIDLIVVNLYPFEATITKENCTFDDAIEQIDIGGPTLLRSAAKNHKYITVLSSPDQYNHFRTDFSENNGNTSLHFRKQCAVKVFQKTCQYDAIIADYFNAEIKDSEDYPSSISFKGKKVQDLRYGENPHQKAAFYTFGESLPLYNYQQLHGKELSYNNILDLSAALAVILEFSDKVSVILKHNNPCGVGTADTVNEAFLKALSTDPLSAFGGIIGFNDLVDLETAESISKSFFECIIAPAYSEEALDKLQKKKNLRLIAFDPNIKDTFFDEIRIVPGGFLVQNKDTGKIDIRSCEIVSKRKPSESEFQALDFSWKIVKHVKSNAIVFAEKDRLIGVGAGQMSRVDSTDLAVMKAKNSGLSTKGAVVASDAFFPFKDAIESLAKAGATAVIQPGGSIRDEEVIQAANENNIAMIFTKMRHFKH
jgi:phosphoribosylaminoimidazolecarboxamide formyltransferase / IMP cyclohydrolase